MLHDPGNENIGAIGQCIDIDFYGVGEIAVDEDRALAGHDHRLGHIALKLDGIAHDLHGAAPQHIGGADDNRVADPFGNLASLGGRFGDAVQRLLKVEFLQEPGKAVAVFSEVDGVGGSAQDLHAGVLQGHRELKGRLAAELHDHPHELAVAPFVEDHFQHVLGGQRFEIEAVGGIVIG